MDVGVITALLQYGGFGILALFFLWDKKESNKRYDQLLKQNADNQAKMLEIEKQNSENMAELKNNLKYNMMCPLIQQTATTKPRRRRTDDASAAMKSQRNKRNSEVKIEPGKADQTSD